MTVVQTSQWYKRRLTSFMLLGSDVVAAIAGRAIALPVTAWIQDHILGIVPYDPLATGADLHRNIFIALVLVMLGLFYDRGLYRHRLPWWSQVKFILKTVIFVLFIHGFLSFTLKQYESRLLILLSWGATFGFIVLFRLLAYVWARRAGLLGVSTTVIADVDRASDLIYAFVADPCTGYQVRQIIVPDANEGAVDRAELPRSHQNIPILFGIQTFPDYVRDHSDEFFIVALDSFNGHGGEAIVSVLNQSGVTYAVMPAATGVNLYRMEPHYFFGHDVMLLQSRAGHVGISKYTAPRMLKRLMDVAISGFALFFLLPVIAVVAVGLKLEGQTGSVFYGGKRIGKGGVLFKCWKFQTMEPTASHKLQELLDRDPVAREKWEKFRKLDSDPRVTTRTARFIRKTSIDELPQLWNVFVGDMSLVGPRPALPDETHYFGNNLDDYLSVQPGITGLWQVSGRNDTSFKRRVYWDSWYVRNWSFWGDIVILIKTPLVLLLQRGVRQD